MDDGNAADTPLSGEQQSAKDQGDSVFWRSMKRRRTASEMWASSEALQSVYPRRKFRKLIKDLNNAAISTERAAPRSCGDGVRENSKNIRGSQADARKAAAMYKAFKRLHLPNAGEIVKPPKHFSWPCGNLGKNPLFIRPCYPELYTKIIQAAEARESKWQPAGRILIGNPGIGKSCLLNYMLIRLLKERRKVCVHLEAVERSLLFADGKCEIEYKVRMPPPSFSDDPDCFHLFDLRKTVKPPR